MSGLYTPIWHKLSEAVMINNILLLMLTLFISRDNRTVRLNFEDV